MAHAVYVCIEAQTYSNKKREKNIDITLPIFGRLFEFFFTQFHEKALKTWRKKAAEREGERLLHFV